VTPKRPAIVPVEVWEQAPEPVQVVMGAMVAYYEQRIAQLEAEVRELTARLNQHSQNSSKPPSSDGPHVKRKPPRPALGRNRGGQRGSPAHHRMLVPVEQVHEGIVCTPTPCRKCGREVQGTNVDGVCR
jgi:transposase